MGKGMLHRPIVIAALILSSLAGRQATAQVAIGAVTRIQGEASGTLGNATRSLGMTPYRLRLRTPPWQLIDPYCCPVAALFLAGINPIRQAHLPVADRFVMSRTVSQSWPRIL